MKHYYHILGLEPDAGKDKVKKAYRRLAMQYHPDVNSSKEAHNKFMEILEAYEYIMGLRKENVRRKQFTPEEWQKITDLYQQAAKEKAKERYRERIKQIRKQKAKEQEREYTIAFYILITIVTLFFSIKNGYDWYVNLMIDSNPGKEIVKVVGIAQKRIFYQFTVDDVDITKEMYAPRVGLFMLSDVGLPVKIGDQFEVEYKLDDPEYHRINFRRMTDDTFNRYFQLASHKLQDDLKEITKKRELKIKADCLTLLIYQNEGPEGLASIIYSDSFILRNLYNNSLWWYFKIRGQGFNSLKRKCRINDKE